jgi:CheY-like chemotaxis protein
LTWSKLVGMPLPDPHSLRKTTLLLVDDNAANLLSLEAVLAGPEYNLLFARSGEEAIELLRENDVAVVLLDLQMPGMDGFETAKVMKTLEHGRNVPIIFVTAVFREDPYIRLGYEAGAVDYFSKPFDPDILKLKVGLYAAFHEKASLVRERERRVQQVEELLRTGRRLSTLLEKSPVGVVFADADGNVVQINDEVSRIWGGADVRQSEFVDWWARIGRTLRGAGSPLGACLDDDQSQDRELTEIRCMDGTAKTVMSCASPLRNMAGEIVGMVVAVHDATEQEQIVREMRECMERLLSVEAEQAGSGRA